MQPVACRLKRNLLQRLGDLLDRPAKVRLGSATLASLLLALLDTAAIVLTLPLVDLVSGTKSPSGIIEPAV